MNKKEFANDEPVNLFLSWAAANLPSIPIHLKVGRSRFVPNSVDSKLKGIQEVSPFYVWRSKGMSRGDWAETNSHLETLSKELRAAVNKLDNAGTLNACKKILEWGGVRNWETGAYPFLQEVNGKFGLSHYLTDTRNAFGLANANTSDLSPPVRSMNAMLTKVHALLSEDGLPIYDSRVAVAIGALVEMWRRSSGLAYAPLPTSLLFPATLRTRTLSRIYPDAVAPGVIIYNQPETAGTWSSAKVRLGWLMQMLSARLRDTWPELTMRKFEATLFMVGYDVTCLSEGSVSVRATQQDYERQAPLARDPIDAEFSDSQDLTSLSGRGSPILVGSRRDGSYIVKWGELSFVLDGAILEEIESEFGGREGVPLGAKMDGEVSPESLGHWLMENGWPSRRYASALAPILVHLKIVKSVSRRAGFVLEF